MTADLVDPIRLDWFRRLFFLSFSPNSFFFFSIFTTDFVLWNLRPVATRRLCWIRPDTWRLRLKPWLVSVFSDGIFSRRFSSNRKRKTELLINLFYDFLLLFYRFALATIERRMAALVDDNSKMQKKRKKKQKKEWNYSKDERPRPQPHFHFHSKLMCVIKGLHSGWTSFTKWGMPLCLFCSAANMQHTLTGNLSGHSWMKYWQQEVCCSKSEQGKELPPPEFTQDKTTQGGEAMGARLDVVAGSKLRSWSCQESRNLLLISSYTVMG